jgi:hypothetical protein
MGGVMIKADPLLRGHSVDGVRSLVPAANDSIVKHA